MAVLADAIEEFKAASPGGKALMLVAIIAVAGVGIYVWKLKQGGNSSTQGTLVPIGTDTSGGDTSGSGTTPPPTPPIKPPIVLPRPPIRIGQPIQAPVGPTKPNPPTTPPPPQPKGQFVTVTTFGTGSWSSTLWGIAQHFYGNGALWQRIAQANGNVNPRDLHIGQRLFVPQ